jgi:hypothetical protein
VIWWLRIHGRQVRDVGEVAIHGGDGEQETNDGVKKVGIFGFLHQALV